MGMAGIAVRDVRSGAGKMLDQFREARRIAAAFQEDQIEIHGGPAVGERDGAKSE